MEKVKAFIERGDDGNYSVYIDLENNTLNYGIHGTGKTVESAKEDFINSYEGMKEFYGQKGKNFVEANFEFGYDIPSFLAYYSKVLSLAGLERLTGVHQGQLSHYVTGHRKPSRRTTDIIQKKLNNFGKELHHLEFV
jgi:predicted RNase H-like HicB family nuclease